MTRWAFAAGAIMAMSDEPVALVMRLEGFIDRPCSNAQRRVWRRRALGCLAARTMGIDEAALRLVAGPDGRRRLDGTAVFASVAYRAGWAAAALSRTPVGIDLEQPAAADVAADVILANVGPNIDLVAWHGLAGVWAAREAALKAQGRDLTRDHRHWSFGVARVRGDDCPALRVDLAERPGIVAAVAYVGT